MTNAMMVYERMNELSVAARAMHASGFFGDVKTEAQAMVKVMAGAEIGLPPFASMTGIHIVQGKPVLGANLVATLVKNDPRYDYRVKRSDGEACVLTWYENGKPVGESGFTIQEASAAGLTGKQTWKAYPSDMLFARALTRGARRYAPGIFGGAPIYTPDELGVETDEDGAIIPGEIVTVTTPAANGKPTATPTNPIAAFVAQAEQRQSVQAVSFANGRLTDWVNYVTGGQFDPARADFLAQVLDRYCSAVADNGNRHTKAAAEKARSDYEAGIAALEAATEAHRRSDELHPNDPNMPARDGLFGDEYEQRQEELKAAALETAQGKRN